MKFGKRPKRSGQKRRECPRKANRVSVKFSLLLIRGAEDKGLVTMSAHNSTITHQLNYYARGGGSCLQGSENGRGRVTCVRDRHGMSGFTNTAPYR
jgi:hypothetical protein